MIFRHSNGWWIVDCGLVSHPAHDVDYDVLLLLRLYGVVLDLILYSV